MRRPTWYASMGFAAAAGVDLALPQGAWHQHPVHAGFVEEVLQPMVCA